MAGGDACVLANVPIARDASRRPPVPGLETESAARQVLPIMTEIENHFEQLADDDGASRRNGPKVPGIGIDQRLIDKAKVEETQLLPRESEEPAGAVERLPDAGRRQLRAVTGKVDVEACIEIGAHRGLYVGMFQYIEIHGDMAAPGVLAEDGGSEIPTWIAQPLAPKPASACGLPRLQRQRLQGSRRL